MKKILVLFFLLLIPLVYYFFVYQNKQSTITSALSKDQKNQALKNILGRSVRDASQKDERWKTYEGKYFSFSYPAYASLYDRKNENIEKNKTIIEHFRIDTFEPRFMFVATVFKLDIKSLDEFSGVVIRRREKDVYEETESSVGEKEAVTFVKKADKAEKATFVFDDGKLYSFVASASHFSEAEEVYDRILSSVKF